jgi:hypothetical protein
MESSAQRLPFDGAAHDRDRGSGCGTHPASRSSAAALGKGSVPTPVLPPRPAAPYVRILDVVRSSAHLEVPVHAHLLPVPVGGDVVAPADATASCRLRAADGSGWLLALTDGATAPYEVEHVDGRSYGSGTSAAVVEFDGPRDATQVAADRRASRERVAPAAMQLEGTLGAITLRAADGGMVNVAFADSPASLEAASHAILSTPLLPGEDPRLLRGPDRYTVCSVEGDGVAAVLRSSGAEVTA